MNDHQTAPATPEDRAAPAPMRLQSLDLDALGVQAMGGAAPDALVCDIDDPSCEVPVPPSDETPPRLSLSE